MIGRPLAHKEFSTTILETDSHNISWPSGLKIRSWIEDGQCSLVRSSEEFGLVVPGSIIFTNTHNVGVMKYLQK